MCLEREREMFLVSRWLSGSTRCNSHFRFFVLCSLPPATVCRFMRNEIVLFSSFGVDSIQMQLLDRFAATKWQSYDAHIRIVPATMWQGHFSSHIQTVNDGNFLIIFFFRMDSRFSSMAAASRRDSVCEAAHKTMVTRMKMMKIIKSI